MQTRTRAEDTVNARCRIMIGQAREGRKNRDREEGLRRERAKECEGREWGREERNVKGRER